LNAVNITNGKLVLVYERVIKKSINSCSDKE